MPDTVPSIAPKTVNKVSLLTGTDIQMGRRAIVRNKFPNKTKGSRAATQWLPELVCPSQGEQGHIMAKLGRTPESTKGPTFFNEEVGAERGLQDAYPGFRLNSVS